MTQSSSHYRLSNYGIPALTGAVVLLGLYASSRYSHLLFHNLVELASILAAFLIFTLVWTTRRVLDNQYLLFIGIASLFSGLLALAHTYVYNEVGILRDSGVDLVTQLWVAYRYLFSISFFLAPLFISRRINPGMVFSGYLIVTGMLIGAIMYGWFPACYRENTGMTPFKITSEYIVSFLLLVSLWLLYRKRTAFDRRVFYFLSGSIVASVVSALSYTRYVIIVNAANMAGHIAELVAAYLIYRAVVVTAIVEPANILFRKLKQSEETIRESEERYRSLIELSPDAIIVHCAGKFAYVNAAGLKLFGAANTGELIGRDVMDFVDIEYRSMIQKRVRESYEEKIYAPTRDIRILRVNGQPVDVEVTSAPTTYSCKPATQVVIRDITSRKEAEQRIEHLASFPMLNPNPVIEVDAQGKIIYCNEAAMSVLKKLSAGNDVSILLPTDMQELLKDLLQKNAAQVVSREVQVQNRTFAETIYFSRVLNTARIYAIDITKRKNAEEALQKAHSDLEIKVQERTAQLARANQELQEEIAIRIQAEEMHARLVSAVESTAEAVVITDPSSGVIQYVNSAFERMTGYTKGETLGRTIHFLESGKHDEKYYTGLKVALQRDGVWSGELVNKKKDGAIYFEECTVSPVRSRDGSIVNYVYIKRDVTEKLRLESIAESVSMLDNIGFVFSGVRHEIGNPINSINMILGILRAKFDSLSGEAIKDYLRRMSDQVNRVEYILQSLKSFNLYETQEPRNVHVASFLEKFLLLIRDDVEKKGIVIEIDIDPHVKSVYADPRALQQVFLNLITNAMDALHERRDPRIRISVSRSDSVIRIQVRDNGAGIAEDKIKDVFRPFYTTKEQGTGLGLVIVKKMLAKMNGTIELESEKDAGTKVNIAIPEGTDERR